MFDGIPSLCSLWNHPRVQTARKTSYWWDKLHKWNSKQVTESLSLISWPLSEQTRSMATSHFQPLTSQLCCQSRRLDGKSTGSTFSFRKPVGFQPCLLESNPEHRPTLFSLYPLCNTIKFQVKVWAGLSSNEWVLQTTALRKNTGWKTGKQFKSCLFPFSTWLFCSLFQDAVCMYKWVLF